MTKKLINFYNNLSDRIRINLLIFFIVFLQILIFFFLNHNNSFAAISLTDGDAFSFYYYNFSNLENFLSQYRSFGGPVIVSIYKFFSNDLQFWGQANFLFFSISLIILFYSLIYFGVRKYFSFFFVIGVLGSTKLWWYFTSWSEVLSVSFIILSFSFYLLSHKFKSVYLYIIFSFLLFFTYQIRPLFITYVVTFVIFEIYLIKFREKQKLNFRNLKLVYFIITPLIIFLFFRFIITGHFGIAPYMGAHVGAHGLFFLDKESIVNVSKKNEKFASDILKRKLKQKYPCNLNFNELQKLNENHYPKCYAFNTMSLMLEMIKYKEPKEPFANNDPRNFNSWQYVTTLDKFFMSVENYNKIDQELKSFSFEIIKPELVNFTKIFLSNIKDSYKIQILSNKKLIYLYSIIILIISTLIIFSKNLKNKFTQKLFFKNNELLMFFLISNLITIVLLSLIHMPKIRIMSVQGIFFIPIIFSYTISIIIDNFTEEEN